MKNNIIKFVSRNALKKKNVNENVTPELKFPVMSLDELIATEWIDDEPINKLTDASPANNELNSGVQG